MKLIPLICPQCNRPLQPESEHIITTCEQCRQIYHLDRHGLKPLDVQFVSTGQTQAKAWWPYWVFQGQVTISKRETQGGGSQSAQEAEQLWRQPRRLYVPAWELPLNRIQEIGGQIIQQQPSLNPIERPDHFTLHPAIMTADDARKMLEFIILAIEARRQDYLKNLAFTMQINEGQLWALPG